ncbi:hypothetical protein C8A05DRAFT_36237, partial [Staphylotrichum tortipilum]
MAPGALYAPIDLRVQIIENCEFFSGPFAHISLVIAKEPLGAYKAIVLKAEHGKRDALLSESGPVLPAALEALHARSAEAVQNYIGTNGFAFFTPAAKNAERKRAAAGARRRDEDAHDDDNDDGSDSDSSAATTLDECESL